MNRGGEREQNDEKKKGKKRMKDVIKIAAIQAAINYILHENHAEWYLFPVTTACGSGAHGAIRGLSVAKVHKSALLAALVNEDGTDGKALTNGFFRISDSVLKVSKLSETAFRKAFGNRFSILPLAADDRAKGYHTYADIPEDPAPCQGKRARSFEKIACRAAGAKWCGALNRIQIDGYEKFIDPETGSEVKIRFEAKGIGGRLTYYCPSEVDGDVNPH